MTRTQRLRGDWLASHEASSGSHDGASRFLQKYTPLRCNLESFVVGAGGVGYYDERFIEYDLDAEDEAWLEAFNRGQRRLPQRRFDLLLWRLETANAEATDAALAAAGEPKGMTPKVGSRAHYHLFTFRLMPHNAWHPPAGGATEWHALRSLSGRSPKLLGCCLESYGLLEQLWRLCGSHAGAAQSARPQCSNNSYQAKRGSSGHAHSAAPPSLCPMQPVCGL